MIHTYQHRCMTGHASARISICYTRFLLAGIASNGFFPLNEVLFYHETPVSPIVGASDIGQVSTAKSSTYFKYFYLLNISLKYFPFVTKENYTKYFVSWRFKDTRSKNKQHSVPTTCKIYTPGQLEQYVKILLSCSTCLCCKEQHHF